MAFTVQGDGPAVVGANSYVEVAFLRTFLLDEGIATTSWTDGQVEAALVSVTRFGESYWPWNGRRTTDVANRLHFPAYEVVIGEGNPRYRCGWVIPQTEIPLSLKEGYCWLAYIQLSGTRVNTTLVRASQVLKKKKLDVIEKEFAAPLAADNYPAAERCFAGLWGGCEGANDSVHELVRGLP